MSSLLRRTGPFAHRNARLYVLFTVLYNARAYYPVLAVFFTDLGLTLERFVLLNLVWALAIFVLEVPSGALADTLGRKKLVVFASMLMVVEMAILLLAPKDGGTLLFALCILNRLLSGTSEAAASGADEALAYDSLPEEGRESAWDEVMGAAMRWRAVGLLLAMALGGLLYDPSWLAKIGIVIPLDIAHRLPVAVVFCQALACVVIALRMEETPHHAIGTAAARCASAFRLTLRTAKMAFTTRSIAVIIFGGLLIDSVARNFATVNSEYLRLISIPEWAFGLIGAATGMLSFFVPEIARKLNARFSPLGVLGIAGALAVVALGLLAPAWPWFGVLPSMLLMTLLGLVGFTVSRHLHASATSSQRATLLSVRGLAFNLGYGSVSLGFSILLARMKETHGDDAFRAALLWQMPAVAVMIALFFAWAWRGRLGLAGRNHPDH
ncbi:MFS transporter [Luteolibacter flavescens]|uniref:MFS transporter n=1 Tax=Luteolibacter flavescens TaxID=1859460 RepID=A0ABT3FLK1_9BACT|nr:MFS transporter [Luteolibacter flavescens]MCW1884332.1 MFS transporter [Luteolibacter flavescens]